MLAIITPDRVNTAISDATAQRIAGFMARLLRTERELSVAEIDEFDRIIAAARPAVLREQEEARR